MDTPTLGSGTCFIIAEVAQAHDGSLGNAHAYIDAAADAGAGAIKFQTHIAHAESTPGEPFRVKFSRQDANRYDYWKRMEFSEEHWRGLAEHANERGLVFISSPFSFEAAELLIRVGQPLWKIASGEVCNLPLLARIADEGSPVILSSGMSPLDELEGAVALLREKGVPFAILQCTSAYPCPPEKIGLNVIPELRERFGCPVGLSDHSGTIYAGLAAAAIGIDVLEVHLTFSRACFGPDVVASVVPSELRQLVDGIRFIERMRANPVDKDAFAREAQPLRDLFTKSVVAAAPLASGTVLTREHLTLKKPGTGIPARRLDDVLGKKLLRDVLKDELLVLADLEGIGP